MDRHTPNRIGDISNTKLKTNITISNQVFTNLVKPNTKRSGNSIVELNSLLCDLVQESDQQSYPENNNTSEIHLPIEVDIVYQEQSDNISIHSSVTLNTDIDLTVKTLSEHSQLKYLNVEQYLSDFEYDSEEKYIEKQSAASAMVGMEPEYYRQLIPEYEELNGMNIAINQHHRTAELNTSSKTFMQQWLEKTPDEIITCRNITSNEEENDYCLWKPIHPFYPVIRKNKYTEKNIYDSLLFELYGEPIDHFLLAILVIAFGNFIIGPISLILSGISFYENRRSRYSSSSRYAKISIYTSMVGLMMNVVALICIGIYFIMKIYLDH